MTNIDPDPETEKGSPWPAVLCMAFISFSSLLSSTTIEVAFPDIMGSLGVGLETAQWCITIFLIVMTVSMLLTADLVQRIGLRATSALSCLMLIGSSWTGGVAESIEILFLSRAVQGFSAGIIVPLGVILVTRLFPPNKIGRAMGVFGAIMLLAPSMGPVIGGFLVEYSSWRILFFIQVPLALMSLLLGNIFLPKHQVKREGRYDWMGFSFLSISLAAGYTCFFLMTVYGLRSFALQVSAFIYFISTGLFIYSECRASCPIVELGIFRNSAFVINLFIIFVVGVGMFSTILLIPYYLLETLHFTPAQVGLSLLPVGVVMCLIAPIAGIISDVVKPATVIIPSLLLFAISGYFLSETRIGSSLTYIIVGAVIGRIGLSFLLPTLYTHTIRVLEGKFVECGSSLINFARQTGGAVGVMYFSTLFAEMSYVNTRATQFDVSNRVAVMEDYNRLHEFEPDYKGVPESEAPTYVETTLQKDIELVSEHLSFIGIFKFLGWTSMLCVFLWIGAFMTPSFLRRRPETEPRKHKQPAV